MSHRLKAVLLADYNKRAAVEKSAKLKEEFSMRRAAFGPAEEEDDLNFDMLSCFDLPPPKGME